MLAMATVVTVFVEIWARMSRRRARHFLHMLKLVYEAEIGEDVDCLLSASTDQSRDMEGIIGLETGRLRKLFDKRKGLSLLNRGKELREEFNENLQTGKLLTKALKQWEKASKAIDGGLSSEQAIGKLIETERGKFGDWFARSIMASPFQPGKFGAVSKILSFLVNSLGANVSTELTTEQFVTRLSRNSLWNWLNEQTEFNSQTKSEGITRRFEEVADASREYYGRSSRVLSIVAGVVFAVAFNINGVTIYQEFLSDPYKAENIIEDETKNKTIVTLQKSLSRSIDKLDKVAEKQSGELMSELETIRGQIAALKDSTLPKSVELPIGRAEYSLDASATSSKHRV